MTTDKKRGDDAQDHIDPKAKPPAVPNDERETEEGAVEVENLSSANDDGAN